MIKSIPINFGNFSFINDYFEIIGIDRSSVKPFGW